MMIILMRSIKLYKTAGVSRKDSNDNRCIVDDGGDGQDRSVDRFQAWTGDTMERAPKTRFEGRLNMLSDACCGQNDDAKLPVIVIIVIVVVIVTIIMPIIIVVVIVSAHKNSPQFIYFGCW